VRLAGQERLEVPMARTFPLEQAMEAVELLRGQHPGGKVALIPAHSTMQSHTTRR
jgi:NADPH2:quinone reductase